VIYAKYGWMFALLAALSSAPLAAASSLFWDASGSNAVNIQSGNGFWDTTTNANWSNGSSDSTWINGSGAAFPLGNSSGGTITIDDGSGTVVADAIAFEGPNYTIAAIPGDTLTLQCAGPVEISTAPTVTGTINAPIAGTSGIDVEENLTLSGYITVTRTFI
jgi:fibronectin-binding autotransporter adhesin